MSEKNPYKSISDQLEKTNYTPNFPDKDSEALILAALRMPLYQAQLCVPGLQKYLSSPPKIKINLNSSNSSQNEDNFTNEEDFWLLTFSRFNKLPTFQVFIEEFGCYIKAHRSFLSISNRIQEIRKMSEEEKDAIIEKVALDIVCEDSYDLSIHQTEEMTEKQLDKSNFYQVRCNYQPEKNRKPSPHIDSEIDKLMKMTDVIAQFSSIGSMEENNLAIIRGENVIFSMNKQAILLGRASSLAEVDIDISTDDDKSCVHISRRQAIISFLPDCKFYIENVGNRPFRVNGVPVLPEQMARIPNFAILDFSGVLFMFIPNKNLVDEIAQINEME